MNYPLEGLSSTEEQGGFGSYEIPPYTLSEIMPNPFDILEGINEGFFMGFQMYGYRFGRDGV